MIQEPLISVDRLNELFIKCLFTDDEVENGAVEYAIKVKGVLAQFGFHPGRIEEVADEIHEMLIGLPPTFQQDQGGGWSFLNMCEDKNGLMWTGEHRMVDQLSTLGQATGWVSVTPNSMNNLMPGGMPYITVRTDRKKIRMIDERKTWT